MNSIGFLVSIVGMATTLFHPLATIHSQQKLLDLRHVPYSSGPLLARALRTGQVRPVFNPRPSGVSSDLTCSPAPCVFPNSMASGGSAPANETPIVVDPRNQMHLLSGANDYSCSASTQGYYASSDGGSTWTRTCGSLFASSGGGLGDPVVAYDLGGVAYRGGIDSDSGGANWYIVVDKSADNGGTWSTPVIAVHAFFSGGVSDKPWMEIDTNPRSPRRNAIYVSSTQFSAANDSEIVVAHSANHGRTWTAVPIGALRHSPVINQFSDLAIGKDGTVYVSWMRCGATGPTGNCGGSIAFMMMSKSTDGGNTWSKAVAINRINMAPDTCGAFYGCLPNTSERVSNIPVIAIDNSTGTGAGSLYVVDYDYTFKHLKTQVASSRDGGATWSRPIGVAPRSDQHDQFFGWINVSSTGGVGVTWMDRRNDPANINYEEFGAVSTDGGTTFPNVQIAANPSNPNNDGFGGGFMGDYTGNAWAGKALYASWTDTSNGSTGQDMIGGLLTP